MKLPRLVKSRKEAKALLEEVFPRPLGYGETFRIETPYESALAVTKARIEQQANMRSFIEWLMSGPKIYKIAHFDLSYGAGQRFEENLSYLHRAFSSAWSREKAPSFLQRLRGGEPATPSEP
jgi:hypothetical protein